MAKRHQGRLGVGTGVVVPTAATNSKDTSFTNVKLEDVVKDVLDVEKLVERLVHRERKVDVKTNVTGGRLERLEKEKDNRDDEEHEASLTGALEDKSKVAKLVVDKCYDRQELRF